MVDKTQLTPCINPSTPLSVHFFLKLAKYRENYCKNMICNFKGKRFLLINPDQFRKI